MHCRFIRTPDGNMAVFCGPRGPRPRCSVPGCGRPVERECDFPVQRRGKPGTCDAKLCATHAKPAGPDRDLCPAHDARVRQLAALAPPEDGLKER
jgi:hypothetical protein